MKQGPLTEKELEWLDSILETYGHQDSVIDVSELDGFLTALLSSPRAIEPEQWMVNIWGGVKQIPAWRTTHERDHFMDLTFQHMADIEERLIDYPEQFEPLLGIQEVEGQALTVMGDWCYGYMRGVALADWPEVPNQLKPALELIALHGLQEYSEHQQKASFSPEQFEKDIIALPAGVLDLHRYWMFHFEQNTPQSLLLTEKISRNDPCPCGSGKKFKQCCLH